MRRLRLLALFLPLFLFSSGPPAGLGPPAALAQGGGALERMIGWITGGQVQITGLTGAIGGTPHADRIEVRDTQGVWLAMEDVTIDWSPTALLRRRAEIQNLTAARTMVSRLPAGGSGGGGSSLPVHVVLNQARLARVELAPPVTGLAQPVVVALSAQADIASLQQASFTIEADGIDQAATLRARGRVTDAALDAQITLVEPAAGLIATVAALPDLGAIDIAAGVEGPWSALAIRLRGDVGELNVATNGTLDLQANTATLDVSATSPAMSPGPSLSWKALALQAKVTGPFAAPQVQGTLRLDSLAAGDTRLQQLAADIAGDSGTVNLTAHADGVVLPGPRPDLLRDAPVQLTARADLQSPARTITLDLQHPRLRASGEVDTAGVLAARLQVELPALAPLAPDTQLAGSASLQLDARLPPEGATLRADGTIAFTEAPLPAMAGQTARLSLQAAMRDGAVVVERLTANSPVADLSATGTWAPAKVAANLEVKLANLALFAPDLRGAATVNATLEGPPDDMVLQAKVDGEAGTTRFAPMPLSATARVAGLPAAPAGRIEASATLEGAPLSLRAEASRGSDGGLRVVIEQAEWKSTTAQGEVALPPGATLPAGELRARIGNLADYRPFIGGTLSGQVTATARREAGGRLAASLEASGLGPVAKLSVQAEGPAEAIVIRLSAQESWTLAAGATLDLPAKTVRVTSLRATALGETTTLEAPARISFGDTVAVDRLRLALAGGTVEIAGRVSPTLDLNASLNGIPAEIARVAVPDLALAGTVQGSARLTGTPAAPQGTVELSASGLAMREGPAAALPPGSVTATATLNGATARLDARATLGSSRVGVTGTVPLSATGTLDLRASGGASLALLDPLVTAEGRQIRGNITLDAEITGAPGAPRVSGTLRLARGTVQDFGQGIVVREINGLIRATGDRLVVERLTARAGPGTIAITGSVGIAAAPEVDLRLRAQNARPIVSDLVTAVLDADVALRGQVGETLLASGRVVLQKVDVNVAERLPTSLPTLPIRRIGSKPEQTGNGNVAPVVRLNLEIAAPGRVYVRGRGLEAELDGQVTVRGTLADPQPQGALTLRRGTFNLLGVVLQLTEGTIRLEGGSQLDPALDFTATTRVNTTDITVHITGNASSPEIKLTSSPELPQDEVLALLLLGRSMAQLSPIQIAQVAAGLAELTGSGGGFDPLGKLRAGLGLDRLSVGANAAGGATVEAGRNIGSGLYLGLKQGTDGGGPQATVQLDLGYGLKLQGEVGTTAGASTATGESSGGGSGLGITWTKEY